MGPRKTRRFGTGVLMSSFSEPVLQVRVSAGVSGRQSGVSGRQSGVSGRQSGVTGFPTPCFGNECTNRNTGPMPLPKQWPAKRICQPLSVLSILRVLTTRHEVV